MGDATGRAAVRLMAGGAGLVSVAVLADSGLEHYRGSFKNSAMYLSLVASTLSMVVTGVHGSHAGSGGLPVVGGASHAGSAAIGLIGLGFHAWGIQRNMGGWKTGGRTTSPVRLCRLRPPSRAWRSPGSAHCC